MIFVRAMPRNRELRYGTQKVGDQTLSQFALTDISGWQNEEVTATSGLTISSTGFNLRDVTTDLSYAYAQVSIGRTGSAIDFDVGQAINVNGVDILTIGARPFKVADPDGKTFGLLAPLLTSMSGQLIKSKVVTSFPSGSLIRGGPNTFLRVVEKRADSYKGAATYSTAANNTWEVASGDWNVPDTSGFQRDPSGLGLIATQARKSVILASTVRSFATLGVTHSLRLRVGTKVVETSVAYSGSANERSTLLGGVVDVEVGERLAVEVIQTTTNGASRAQVRPGLAENQTRISIY